MKSDREELAELLALPTGDRVHAEQLVAEIVAGRLRLPPCFNLRGRPAAETQRAHELARKVAAS